VYNTGTLDIPAGIYVWNGEKWTPIGGDPDVITDAQENDYTIAELATQE
jgi:hypothetical protein